MFFFQTFLSDILFLLVACSTNFRSSESFVLNHRPATFSSSSSPSKLNININTNQVLTFQEPSTNVTVMLVGAMHYNPASIKLANDTIFELGKQNKLGSVVIESCSTRWNNTMKRLYETDPEIEKFLGNEMRTASEAAFNFERPVVLGDLEINITGQNLKSGFQETISDLFLRPKEYIQQIKNSAEVALPSGKNEPEYLGPFSLFSPQLMLASPVSLFKYPLSYLAKNPITFVLVIASLFILDNVADATTTYTTATAATTTPLNIWEPTYQEPVLEFQDYFFSLFFSFLETAIFARLFVKELLEERNVFLARNILKQCQLYSTQEQQPSVGALSSLFSTSFTFPWQNVEQSNPSSTMETPKEIKDELELSQIVYAKNDPEQFIDILPLSSLSKTKNKSNGGEEKVVVAVLGMAHCNGIMKLLQEQRV
eukprot:CAMPEP_0178965104 /NCGR_PEP_ID=MMETSP0789-20121207/16077_1 /TAXON_ID=3005 /ORGANISM="Rhizosolenia setigera, Strain CCMP 1694" /LENGTH=426 /DNA_ID=CAMNT_0020650013 /DNA_START=45 /DNA_END=1325 /DNA_ORIENTATION=+